VWVYVYLKERGAGFPGFFFFFGGGGGGGGWGSGADPEAICNFYLILKIIL